jgi:phosphoribulokinase
VDDVDGSARPPGSLVLAVAGDSASGKSTLSRGIAAVLGDERVGRICADDYHRYDRSTRAELGVTPLSPRSNRLDLLSEHLDALGRGAAVTKPTYDHATGSFGPDERWEPSEFVIVEGLLPLADRAALDAIDVAVYLDPQERLRRRWKLERDVFERGYLPADVVAELARREGDAAAFVRPQRQVADIVVAFEPSGPGPLAVTLTVRPVLPYPDLRARVGALSADGAAPIAWSIGADDRGPMSVLEIDGACPPEMGAELEDVIWSYLPADDRLAAERIGIVQRPGHPPVRSEPLALAQLIIIAYLVGTFDWAFDL